MGVYHRMRSREGSREPREANIVPLKSVREGSRQAFKKIRPSPYSIPQTTVSESRDRITMIPANAVEIEAGSDADSAQDTALEGKWNDITVVTSIGIDSYPTAEGQTDRINSTTWTLDP